ncbi:MAG: urease accessory protein UreE [Proteobacteria bacterium]|nr:urease accessory protein UreE [Pseudomonadota bacterium]
MLRAISHSHGGSGEPAGTLRLDHAARHLRRKLVVTDQGEEVMVDLSEPVLFADGDRLVLQDGRSVAIVAADEELYEVKPGPACPLRHLAWHLGNRHLPAQIDETRILIQRDHVIRAMLEGLGASVREVVARFQPVYGAYHANGLDHGHGHTHGHGHHHHD